jgi:hypothetical protein
MSQPRKAMEKVVESAMLYSVAALIYIPLYATSSTKDMGAVSLYYVELVWTNMAVSASNYCHVVADGRM